MTADVAALTAALDAIEAGGGTALYDAVVESVRALGAHLLVSYSDENGLLLRRWRACGEVDPRKRFRDLFRDYYPRVEIRERQLLHSGQGDSNRNVVELLVLCEG